MTQFFTNSESALFFRLLLSHLFADFVLKPNSWVIHSQQNLYRSKYLYWHSLTTGLLAYMLVGSWASIWILMFVGVVHGLTDYIELKYGSSQPLRSFLVNQVVHFFIIVLTWLLLTDKWLNVTKLTKVALMDRHIVAVFSGYIICTTPIGYLVGMATDKWQRQLKSTLLADTLEDAGRWIGITERVLIFSFVLLNQYEAIGFLIAAKSILRFREGEKAAKQSEYVLVGTLLSYSLAILIGLLTKIIIE